MSQLSDHVPGDRPESSRLTYTESGVRIDAGNTFITRISPLVKATHRAGVCSQIGGFSALFDLKAAGFRDPILVAANDGVGTKLRIAIDTEQFQNIGIDLVAMCVNDLVCHGAEPLFFLDYFATAKLNIDVASQIIESIAKGCDLAGCSLIGGETAEMPGMYYDGDLDLAGFSVGAVERGYDLPRNINEGDLIIGLASNGLHSNGFSLVRNLVGQLALSWEAECPWSEQSLGSALLQPTRIYTKSVLEVYQAGRIKGIAHITGGGLTENIPRILPRCLGACIDIGSWKLPEVFVWLLKVGQIDRVELLRTFNMGIGMILVVSPENEEVVSRQLNEAGESVATIGQVIVGQGVTCSGSFQ